MTTKLIIPAVALLLAAPADLPTPSRGAIVASLDPAVLAAPPALEGPIILAHGNLGIPRVITWNNSAGTSGIAWGSTASIAAGNAYVTWNGTDMLLNVPTGDGFSFLVNNVEVGSIQTTGEIATNVIQILSGSTLTLEDAAGNDLVTVTDAGTTGRVGMNGASTYLLHVKSPQATSGQPANLGIILEDSQATVRRGGVYIGAADDINVGTFSNHTAHILMNDAAAGGGCLELLTGGQYNFGRNVGGNVCGTTAGDVFAGTFSLNDSNVRIAETGTNDLALTSDNGVSATLSGGTTANLLLAGVATIQLGDSNVAIAESGTNDLDITADGAVAGTFSSTGLALADSKTLTMNSGSVGATSFLDFKSPQMGFKEADGTDLMMLAVPGPVGTGYVAFGPNTNVRVMPSATDDLGLWSDNGLSATLSGGTTANLLLAGVATIQFGDSNVAVAESGTNDLALTADGGVELTITGAGSTFGGNIEAGANSVTAGPFTGSQFILNDSNVRIVESGTNDLDLIADAVVVSTLSSTGQALRFGTSTGVIVTVAGTLNTNTTAVGNVGVGEDDLMTYALPANALVVTGRGIYFKAWGTGANNANAKTLTCYAGSQAVLTNAFTVSLAESWEVEAWFIRTGASTQDWRSTFFGNTGAAGSLVYDPELGTATQTETSAITFKCTGTATANDDIVQEGFVVEAF